MKRRLFAVISWLFVFNSPFTHAIQPSFSCSATSELSAVEQAICGSFSLSTLDRELAERYAFLKNVLDSKAFAALKSKQKSWLETRNQCNDQQCLIGQYEGQILRFKQYPVAPFLEEDRCLTVGPQVYERVVGNYKASVNYLDVSTRTRLMKGKKWNNDFIESAGYWHPASDWNPITSKKSSDHYQMEVLHKEHVVFFNQNIIAVDISTAWANSARWNEGRSEVMFDRNTGNQLEIADIVSDLNKFESYTNELASSTIEGFDTQREPRTSYSIVGGILIVSYRNYYGNEFGKLILDQIVLKRFIHAPQYEYYFESPVSRSGFCEPGKEHVALEPTPDFSQARTCPESIQIKPEHPYKTREYKGYLISWKSCDGCFPWEDITVKDACLTYDGLAVPFHIKGTAVQIEDLAVDSGVLTVKHYHSDQSIKVNLLDKKSFY